MLSCRTNGISGHSNVNFIIPTALTETKAISQSHRHI